jgi:hypothetical protein
MLTHYQNVRPSPIQKKISNHSINHIIQKQSSTNSVSTASLTPNTVSDDDFDLLEEQFVNTEFKPYLASVFADFAQRSVGTPKSKNIDKVTFIQYLNLPGMLAERLQQCMTSEKDGSVSESEFVRNMLVIYSQRLDQQMELVFKL